jgi:hypothetical protein
MVFNVKNKDLYGLKNTLFHVFILIFFKAYL